MVLWGLTPHSPAPGYQQFRARDGGSSYPQNTGNHPPDHMSWPTRPQWQYIKNASICTVYILLLYPRNMVQCKWINFPYQFSVSPYIIQYLPQNKIKLSYKNIWDFGERLIKCSLIWCVYVCVCLCTRAHVCVLMSSTVHYNSTSVFCYLHTCSVSGTRLVSSRHTAHNSGIWSCILTRNFWPSYSSIQDSTRATAWEKYLGNKIIRAWCTVSIFSPHKLPCYFIMLPFLVHIIFMFYIKNMLKFKCPALSVKS
jgi:hypothetical protein